MREHGGQKDTPANASHLEGHGPVCVSGPGWGGGMGPVQSSMGPVPCPTPPSTGTSPAAEFKELRSCPPREKEPVQPWEGDVLDVDLVLSLFLQLVCSGVFS